MPLSQNETVHNADNGNISSRGAIYNYEHINRSCDYLVDKMSSNRNPKDM